MPRMPRMPGMPGTRAGPPPVVSSRAPPARARRRSRPTPPATSGSAARRRDGPEGARAPVRPGCRRRCSRRPPHGPRREAFPRRAVHFPRPGPAPVRGRVCVRSRVRVRRPPARIAEPRPAGSEPAGGAASVSSAKSRPTPRRRCCRARSPASSAAGMTRLIRPLTMIATSSAMAVATPMFCSMRRTATSPSVARVESSSSSWATMRGASPSVGSSRTRRRGSWRRAREMASICCSPPESCPPPLRRLSARRGKTSYTRSTVPRAAAPAGEAQMLLHGEGGPEPAALRRVCDAPGGHLVGGESGDVAALEPDRAAADREEPHDGVAQGGLAHAVAPDHRVDSLVQGEIDALQGVGLVVVDVKVADLQGRRGGGAPARSLGLPPGSGPGPLSHGRAPGRAPAPPDRSRSRPGCLP